MSFVTNSQIGTIFLLDLCQQEVMCILSSYQSVGLLIINSNERTFAGREEIIALTMWNFAKKIHMNRNDPWK